MECLVIRPFNPEFDIVEETIQSSVTFSLPEIRFIFLSLKGLKN